MDIKIIARGVAYRCPCRRAPCSCDCAEHRQYPTAEASRTEPSPATAALDAELAHCQTIGPEAADDGACKAVWEANRRRFFESGKLYRDRVTDAVPATPDVKEPASPLAKELPTSAPQSPSTPNSNAPQPAGRYRGAAAMNTGVIDRFTEVFTRYIDSGFGLLGGEVAFLASTLIVIDVTLAGLFWAWGADEDIIAHLVKKTLFVGFFAFLIGNFNALAKIVFNSFAGLGLKAAGSSSFRRPVPAARTACTGRD